METVTDEIVIANVAADVPPDSMIENVAADVPPDIKIENVAADVPPDINIENVTVYAADVPQDSMIENVAADVPPDIKIENVAADVTVYNPYAKKSAINNTALLVEGHKLYVSKAVLSLASPVFRSMFELDMEEKNMDEIPLPGKGFDDMVKFLECIYPDTRKPITGENAGILFPLFDEYQFDDLKASCQRALIESCTDDTHIDKMLECLLLASTYDMAELRIKCLNLASRAETSTLMSHRIIHDLPPAVTQELWKQVADNRDTEIKGLHAMCRRLEGKRTSVTVCPETICNVRWKYGRRREVEHKAYSLKWETVGEQHANYEHKDISSYITPIKMAIAHNFSNALAILLEMCAAELHYMGSEGSSSLLKHDLPNDIVEKLVYTSNKNTYPDI